MTSGTITREQFEVRQIKDKRALSAQKKQVLICAGTGCIAGGSLDIYDYLKEACAKRGIQVQVGLLHEDGEVEAPAKGKELHLKKSGCHGFCRQDPFEGGAGGAAAVPAGRGDLRQARRDPLLQKAAPGGAGELRLHRRGGHRRIHRPGRLLRL